MVGATVMPATRYATASVGTAPAVSIGNWRGSGARRRSVPNTRPLSPEPTANNASTIVAAPGTWRWAVNATATTSMTPKIVPIDAMTTTSTQTTGFRITDPPEPAGISRTGGSVPRSAASASVPATSNTAPSSGPASGKTATHSPTDSPGPTTKHSSSTTDSKAKAVRSFGDPRYSSVHRARTIAPMVGMTPAGTAQTKKVQAGAPSRTHSSIAAVAAALVPDASGSTRRCPYRSTARETIGVITAFESANTAASAPPSP